MSREYYQTRLRSAALVLVLLLVAMIGSTYGGEFKRSADGRPARLDFCEEIQNRDCTIDVDPSSLPGGLCDPVKTVGHFTLRFRGVDNDYERDESMWFYALEWDGELPEVSHLAIGLGECIARINILGGCPAGYSVGIDPRSGIYSVWWDSNLPAIPELRISFLVNGIYEVGAVPFAISADGENHSGTICGLICEETCELEVTCPPEVALECTDPADPEHTGYPVIEGTCPPFDTTYTDTRFSGNCPYNYIIERRWEITDASGVVRSCVQNIIVEDTTPPTVVCGPDSAVACNEPVVFPDPVVSDNCDPDPVVRAVSSVTPGPGPCEETYEMCWEAEDACGNISESCCMTIVRVVDTEPPEITCPPDVEYECDDIGEFGEATAVDNCDPEPKVTYWELVVSYKCPWNYTIKRKWTATDKCGNSSSCVQFINIRDTEPPVVTYCPPDTTIACGDWWCRLPHATAEDNCNPQLDVKYEAGRLIREDSCEYWALRSWEWADGCGNKSWCQQVVTVRDEQPPVLTCADDDTIGCDEPVEFTEPAVIDTCDPEPVITVLSTTVIPKCEDGVPGECTEDWDAIHTRCWEAVDRCGNADTCCQTIYVDPCEDEMCSYTKGGWGSRCPEPQQDDMMSTQPGCIRDHYFDMVFPSGVTIGDFGGGPPYGVLWTSAAAVEAFLPGGGTPSRLTGDLVDPTDTPAGNLAAQLLALTLNREYSCAGVWDTLGLTSSATCYGGFMIPNGCGKFAGLTVDEFLAIANQAVGGNMAVLEPYGADSSDANETADCLNNLYDECDPGHGNYLEDAGAIDLIIAPEPKDSESRDDVRVPVKLMVSSQPNPLTGSTTVSYGLPVAGNVSVEIYDIQGKKVVTLLNEHKPAGLHGVVWNGKDSAGDAAVTGVYFCRVQIDNGPVVMEKLIKF